MRILVVNWQDRENPNAGGAETHLHEIFGRIATAGNQVDLLCSGFAGAPPRALLDGIEIHRVGRRHSFGLLARAAYDSRLRARTHDVLVEDINKVPLLTPRWNAGPTVALVHHLFGLAAFAEANPIVASIVWSMERSIPRAYRGIPFEAVSESTAQDLARQGIPRDAIRVIHNGVDLRFLTPDPSARVPVPTFAYVGRLRRYKRVDFLIRAVALVPGAQLVIAGAGPERGALEQLVNSLDLGARVRFLGFVTEEEKRSLLRSAWATVIASIKEGWGIGNIESAACGTPVIAVDAPGVRDSVIDAKTGILVRDASPRGLAAAMGELADDHREVVRLGTAARTFAERFTWERAAGETLGHLTEVVAGGR